MDVRAAKLALRSKYAALRKQIPEDVRRDIDEKICRALITSASFRYARCILAYAPKTPEVDIMPAVLEALKQGKRVAFPLCCEEHTIRFFYAGPEELVSGAFGIREPACNALPCTDFQGAICLVPGLLFDTAGYRIGYGKGYYDRFLSDFPGATLGIVRRDFILPSLPQGRYDRPVGALISERGVQATR